MKHSNRLLSALVVVATALLLLFWPRPAAATADDSFEQRCEAEMLPHIQVTATPPTFALKTGLSSRVLSARTRHASASHLVMGMTASRTLADIGLDGPTLTDPSGTRECVAPRIDVQLSFEPLDVFIAREFPMQSCAYRAVLKHEMQHVKIYTEGLARIERVVHGELNRRYGGKPLYAKAGQGIDALQRQLDSWLTPLIREQLAQVEVLQSELDTVEQTDQLSHACLGEVAMMMGSSF